MSGRAPPSPLPAAVVRITATSAQLPAQPFDVTKNPSSDQKSVLRGEERGTVVAEDATSGSDTQQRTGVGAGVAQPHGCPLPARHEVHDVVVEVRRTLLDLVAVSPPAVPPRVS